MSRIKLSSPDGENVSYQGPHPRRCRQPDPTIDSGAMAVVAFTPTLQRHGECPTVEAAGATVGAVLARVFEDRPRLRGYVVDERCVLRKHMVVFVDGAQIVDREGLTDAVGPRSEVYVMQALSGG